MTGTATAGAEGSRRPTPVGEASASVPARNRLLDSIIARSPLLRELVFRQAGGGMASAPPACLGAALGFLRQDNKRGGAAFVLPVAGPAAVTVAVLHALAAAADDFDEKVAPSDAGEPIRFASGDYVQLNPEGWVYVYKGIEALHGRRYIRLCVPDSEGRSHFLAVEEGFRLHQVEGPGKRPRKRERPGEAGPSALAQLLNTGHGANIARLPNHLMLLSSRGGVTEFVQRVHVGPSDDPEAGVSLQEVLTWGRITSDGELVSEDKRTGGRPPLIAVTHSIDSLAVAGRAVAERPRAVVIDGASRIANLQAFDDLVSRHRVVVIAEHGEEDILRHIADRNVAVWHMEPSELLLGVTAGHRPERHHHVFGGLIRGARNARDLELQATQVPGGPLDLAADALIRAEREGRASGGHSEEVLDTLLTRAYRLLLAFSERLGPPGEEAATLLERRIGELKSAIRSDGVWLPEPVHEALLQAADHFLAALRSSDLGEEKRKRLQEVIDERPGGRIAVVFRFEAGASAARDWLRGTAGSRVTVLSVAQLMAAAEEGYTTLLIGAWPTRQRMEKLVACHSSPEVRLVAYGFEHDWFASFERRHAGLFRGNVDDPDEKERLTGVKGWSEQVVRSPDAPSEPDDPLSRLLEWSAGATKGRPAATADQHDMRQATYVGFHGSTYTYLTDGHRVPVITDIVLKGPGEGKVHLRSVQRLNTGDFLLFREHGNRTAIEVVAEAMAGTEEYERLRTLANAWREPLQELGPAERVYRRLRGSGVKLSRAALRSWLWDDDRIGPQSPDHVRIIAETTGDGFLRASLDDVVEAIRTVRRLHREAGHRLTQLVLNELPGKLRRVDDMESRINLTLGSGWVVQVEAIGDEKEERPYWEVNQLLWADH